VSRAYSRGHFLDGNTFRDNHDVDKNAMVVRAPFGFASCASGPAAGFLATLSHVQISMRLPGASDGPFALLPAVALA
jgi:hypothetical protein